MLRTLILGLDFLEGNKVVIDHGQFNISINQELIPASYTSNDENEDIQIYRIKVTRTVVIPPYSVQCVETNLNLQPRADIVIQPSPSLGEILTPNALLPAKQEAHLLIKNPTDIKITLKENQLFGLGIEADTVMDTNISDIHTIKINSIKRSHPVEEQERGNLERQLPEHLNDLYQRSIQNLNKTEAAEIAKLLLDYQDIFAKNDLDIGVFNGYIKHKIDTGNAKPVKQR